MIRAVMQDESPARNAGAGTASRAGFLDDFCLPFLGGAQNADGGWGYRLGSRSAVEPTCWALLALSQVPKSSDRSAAAGRGCDWLCQAQLPDGSWPAHPGQQEGCWVTALACLALHAQGQAFEEVARGIRWLCDAWPAEGGFWWRLRQRLFGGHTEVRQNHALRGWSWTRGTSSWVEPTSYALVLLRSTPEALHPVNAAKRRWLGEAMLYDRMCPEGGWNCGNPVVYGVPGQPEVGPTAWALLALRDYEDRAENRQSLQWLEHAYESIQGPASLSLAHLCLETYGRPTPPLEPGLQSLYALNQFFHNVLVVSWAAVALTPGRSLFQWATEGGSG